jgi:hypothetical protein
MPDDHKELKYRLRDLKREAENEWGLLGNTRANTLHEAADLIESLERDVELVAEDHRRALSDLSRYLKGDPPCYRQEREEAIHRADRNAAVLEALTSDLKNLPTLNDEQIAARRGPMHDWATYRDVILALQHAQEQVGGSDAQN